MFAFPASSLSGNCLPPGTADLHRRHWSGGCVHPKVLIATPTSVFVSSVACGGTGSYVALHHEPDHFCSAGAAVPIATSSRQSLGRWGSRTFTTCISLNPEPHRIAHDACCLWLLIDCNFPFAIAGWRDSQTFSSCSS